MRTTSTSAGTPATTEASSASTSSVRAPECSRIARASGALGRALSGTRTPPAAGTPKCASSSAGAFGDSTATRSRRLTPRACSAEASRLTRASSSSYVRRRSPWTTAMRSGWRLALRFRKETGSSSVRHATPRRGHGSVAPPGGSGSTADGVPKSELSIALLLARSNVGGRTYPGSASYVHCGLSEDRRARTALRRPGLSEVAARQTLAKALHVRDSRVACDGLLVVGAPHGGVEELALLLERRLPLLRRHSLEVLQDGAEPPRDLRLRRPRQADLLERQPDEVLPVADGDDQPQLAGGVGVATRGKRPPSELAERVMDAMQRLDGGGGVLGGAADGDVDELAHAEGGIEVVGALVVQHDELRRVGQPGGLRAVDAQQRRVAGDEVAHARAQLEDAALARGGRDQAVGPMLATTPAEGERTASDGTGGSPAAGRRLAISTVELVPDQVDQPRGAQALT